MQFHQVGGRIPHGKHRVLAHGEKPGLPLFNIGLRSKLWRPKTFQPKGPQCSVLVTIEQELVLSDTAANKAMRPIGEPDKSRFTRIAEVEASEKASAELLCFLSEAPARIVKERVPKNELTVTIAQRWPELPDRSGACRVGQA